jgi:hypothetical protein
MTGTTSRFGRGSCRSAPAVTTALLATILTSCSTPEPSSRADSTSGAAAASSPAGTATGSPTSQSAPRSPAGAVDAVRTVVISDEGDVGSDERWPDRLAGTLESSGIPMSVETAATEGAGYSGTPGFEELVERHAVGSTQLVVLFDSRIDSGSTGVLAEEARRTFTAVERAAPDALLVVVGPLSDGSSSPARAELSALADEFGATVVDPSAEGWPPSPGQDEIADLLRPHIEPLADALAASGANR